MYFIIKELKWCQLWRYCLMSMFIRKLANIFIATYNICSYRMFLQYSFFRQSDVNFQSMNHFPGLKISFKLLTKKNVIKEILLACAISILTVIGEWYTHYISTLLHQTVKLLAYIKVVYNSYTRNMKYQGYTTRTIIL